MKHEALYQVLGVPPTALAHQIKKAWRKLAQATHPDREGGDETRYKAIQTAYDVLGDEERRAKYDATGETTVPDINAEMLQELFFAVIDSAQSIETQDVVKEVRGHLAAGAKQVASDRNGFEAKSAKVVKAKERLKFKGVGRNVLSDMLDAQQGEYVRAIEVCDTKSKKLAQMTDILKTYAYATDKPQFEVPNDPYAALSALMGQQGPWRQG